MTDTQELVAGLRRIRFEMHHRYEDFGVDVLDRAAARLEEAEAHLGAKKHYATLELNALRREALEALSIQEAALLDARATFQEYVRLHRAKSPPDEVKAQANFEHADKIGMALTRAAALLAKLKGE